MMHRSHSRLSYYRIHFVHSYLSAYLHSFQDLNDCCDSPLVHVVLGVVQPHAHLHGVTLPDEVEDVLHGEAAVVPCVPCISPVVPCLAQHQVYHNHCWVLVRPGVLLPSRAQQPPAQNWTALTLLAFPRSARQLTSLVWQREHLQPPALSWSRGPGLKTCTT